MKGVLLDAIKNQKVQLIITTPSSEEAKADGRKLRRSAFNTKSR